MARSHARLVVTIWSDPGYAALTMRAQWLYAHLLAHPRLTLAGTIDLSERRWARLATDATEADVIDALGELEAAGMVVTDEATEELMVRSFTRHDITLGRWNRNLSAGFWRCWNGVLSPDLRSRVVSEVPDDLWTKLEGQAPAAALQIRRSPRLEPQDGSRFEPDPPPRFEPPSPSPSPSPFTVPQSVASTSQSDSPPAAATAEGRSEGSGSASRRARAFAAVRIVAEGELTQARNRGRTIRSEEGFLATALDGATRRHGSKANDLAHQHPEWTAEQIAAHLLAPGEPADDAVSPSAIYAAADERRRALDAEADARPKAAPETVAAAAATIRANLAQPDPSPPVLRVVASDLEAT